MRKLGMRVTHARDAWDLVRLCATEGLSTHSYNAMNLYINYIIVCVVYRRMPRCRVLRYNGWSVKSSTFAHEQTTAQQRSRTL